MRMMLLATLILFATTATAGLYKWVDEDGNVHYSQKRPRDKKYEQLKAPRPAPEDAKPLYKNSLPEQSSNNSSSTTTAESAKNLKLREENCTKAKERLQTYEVYRRLRDSDGNIIVVDDKVRAKNINEAKQAVSDFCN